MSAGQVSDVSGREIRRREAEASGCVTLRPEALEWLTSEGSEALAVARVAGIMAAKRASELVPLCHPVGLDHAAVTFEPEPPGRLRIHSSMAITGRAGVVVEAMTAVSVAALSIHYACKVVDPDAEIGEIRMVRKS